MNAHHNRTAHHQFLPELRKSRATPMWRATPCRKRPPGGNLASVHKLQWAQEGLPSVLMEMQGLL